ncbi:diguanylate cyclase [Bordetella avium]|uniref:GGDEF domain-containing protein n=1 Tax=Bordetella avium TaxID=521 RepID=UPI000FD759CF|nr:GGDEF domain-containing protein [Bordetella avium]AZY49208.1 diguanylate cyclase [Bordetella avium]
MNSLISQLSASLPAAGTLEQLTRPLLDMLSTVTDMESTYLTSIDLRQNRQRVDYARNAGDMQIPEGLEVSWSDTLCRRALAEGCMYTNDVASRWGDSDAARALGIKTYLSAPVRAKDGHLLGTICAASASIKPMREDAQAVIVLFSSLVASFIEREMLITQVQDANQQLRDFAMHDALTGLPNRRALFQALELMLSRARVKGETLLVGLMDLDGFKQVNDNYGHQVGDAFLRALGARVAGALRPDDVLGRLGGDEFLLLASGPQGREQAEQAARALQQRVQDASSGDYALGGLTLPYDGASVGVALIGPRDALDADQAVRLADARMYEVKRSRQAARLDAAG